MDSLEQVELESGEVIGYISLMDSGELEKEASAMAEKLKRKAAKQGQIKPLEIKVGPRFAWRV